MEMFNFIIYIKIYLSNIIGKFILKLNLMRQNIEIKI